MRKKLLIGLVALLLGGGLAFKLLAPPAPEPPMKIEGDVYVLPKAFLINLAQHRYVKLSIALVIAHHEDAGAASEGAEGGAAAPPEGYGALPQEAVVRSIVTDVLSAQPASRFVRASSRERLKRRILVELERRSDVHATRVLFTDLAVQ